MNLRIAIIALGPIGSIAIYYALRSTVAAIRRWRIAKQRRG